MDAVCKICCIPIELLSKVPGIGPLVKLYSTSVGQKILMAVTGLSLCGFLVAHLSGNLLLFVGEEEFNAYAAKLHSLGPLLALAETGLFATFALHIALAMSTAAMNRRARKAEYEMKESKQGVSALPKGGASSWMLVTGLLILGFLVLHIADMKLNARGMEGGDNKYQLVRSVLRDNIVKVVYGVGLIALGIHLSHGMKSAVQSLGFSHRRWNKLIHIGGLLFAWGVAAGFLSLLAWGSAAP